MSIRAWGGELTLFPRTEKKRKIKEQKKAISVRVKRSIFFKKNRLLLYENLKGC